MMTEGESKPAGSSPNDVRLAFLRLPDRTVACCFAACGSAAFSICFHSCFAVALHQSLLWSCNQLHVAAGWSVTSTECSF